MLHLIYNSQDIIKNWDFMKNLHKSKLENRILRVVPKIQRFLPIINNINNINYIVPFCASKIWFDIFWVIFNSFITISNGVIKFS